MKMTACQNCGVPNDRSLCGTCAYLSERMPELLSSPDLRLAAACLTAAEAFERYEEMHRRKGPDGHEKAEQNKYLAIQMREALRQHARGSEADESL